VQAFARRERHSLQRAAEASFLAAEAENLLAFPQVAEGIHQAFHSVASAFLDWEIQTVAAGTRSQSAQVYANSISAQKEIRRTEEGALGDP